MDTTGMRPSLKRTVGSNQVGMRSGGPELAKKVEAEGFDAFRAGAAS